MQSLILPFVSSHEIFGVTTESHVLDPFSDRLQLEVKAIRAVSRRRPTVTRTERREGAREEIFFRTTPSVGLLPNLAGDQLIANSVV